MHPSAMANGKRFFDTYVSPLGAVTIAEIGSQDVNGSLRQVAPVQAKYIGLDFADARGVDIVLTDPYHLPFENESVDVVVSSSCLEHSEMFWLAFLEMLRVLKPGGLCYLNVPSNGAFHRYPVDCWRFYPDAGAALVKWAQRSGYNPALLEAFTAHQTHRLFGEFGEGNWNDQVSIYVKDASKANSHPRRITATFRNFDNGYILGQEGFTNLRPYPEDRRNQDSISWLSARAIQLPIMKTKAILGRFSRALTRRSSTAGDGGAVKPNPDAA